MATILNINKKTVAIAILLAGLLISLSIAQVRAAANDSSITLKKDPASGLFTLTIKDPDGIQEFSMTPAGKFPYGGGLSGCPKSFSINNVSFADPSDFEPAMKAYVIDCSNNTANLEIAAPKDGLAKSTSVVKEEAAPSPKPLPKEEPKKEKKEGPLSAADIQYPVPELGNCQSEAECRSYCDNSQHAKECFAFAKKYNLISEREANEAEKKFFEINNGPGGCNSGTACESYCNNVDHLDECIAFAEKSGYYSGDQLAEAKKFQELSKSGKQFPGGCKDRNTCELYCNNPQHMEECLNFAEESGFMPKEEIEQARKILPLMQRGETPGGCTSKEQCEKYCFEENHTDECTAFGEKVGLISPEDAAMIKKTGGKGPGGCHSKEQCEAYCQNNSDECFRWAQDNGFFSEADLSRMKTGLTQFKEQLDKIPPEVVQCLKGAVGEKNFEKLINGQPVFDRSLEGKMKSCFSQVTSQLSHQLNTIPPEAAQCIKDAIGEEGLRKLQSGEFDENVNFSNLETCFQRIQSSFGGGPPRPGELPRPGGGFTGPGGCKSIEECTSYCQANPKECQQFAPPAGAPPPGGFPGGGATQGQFPGGGATGGQFPGGPGGCKSVEECTAYCQSNPDACKGFQPPPGILPPSNYPGPSSGGPPPTGQNCVPSPSGLISWWSGDAVSGTTAQDINDSNAGTMSGGVTIVPGQIGKAFKLDGNGYIKMGNPANLNFGTSPFSLEAWLNWDGGGSSKNNIIRKSNYPVSGDGAGYWLAIGKDNQTLEFFTGETVGNPDKPRGRITTPINPGTWHHVIATRNSSGTMKLYLDGEAKGTAEAANANTTSEAPFVLGAWDDRFGVTEFFSGLLDEVSVYNRALDASEIQTIFHAGSSGRCSSSSRSYPSQPTPEQYRQYQQQYPSPVPPPASAPSAPAPNYEYKADCSFFTSAPSCSYVGPTDSESYKLCKQCFPEK